MFLRLVQTQTPRRCQCITKPLDGRSPGGRSLRSQFATWKAHVFTVRVTTTSAPGAAGFAKVNMSPWRFHLVLTDLAAIAPLAQSPGPDGGRLPILGLVDGNDPLVAAGEDQEAVGFVDAALGGGHERRVETDHLDDVVAVPRLGPAIPVAGVGARALVWSE